MMAKTFHGKVDETVDALIILEACRQGALPRITRRLFAAERGETRSLPEESTPNNNPSSCSSTRQSVRRPAVSSSSATASSLLLLTSTSTTATSSPSSSSPTRGNTQAPVSSPTSSSSFALSATPNPSLIIPGSVFVFDEEESGIHRWTDGKIWSPSRICGNFLVYRELYRKLPDQKCYTTSEKALMKDGIGLKDQKLKEKVDKENLVVMGCMKGTFVLKNGGLIKKTICVKGVNLVPAEELKKQLEGSSSSSSGKGGRGSGRGKGANHNMLPGFSTGSAQHLVCYERPGEMSDLYGPRDYLELRNLPISRTFVMMQTYRVPIKILPLEFRQLPLDPADEYIHSSRVVEARSAKPLVADSSDAARTIIPTKRGVAKRRQTQGQKREGANGEPFEKENEGFNYLVDDACNSDSDYDTQMSASRPTHFRPPVPVASITRVVRHNYPTRSQDRQVREQIRQQLQPWSPSPPPFESESLASKKRKAVPSKRVDEESSLIKIEKGTPTLSVSYPVGCSSGRSLQLDDHTERDQLVVVLRPPATARCNPAQMQDFLDSMSNKSSQFDQGDDNEFDQGDDDQTIYENKSARGYWRIDSSSSRSSSSSSDTIDPPPQHEGGNHMIGFGPPPPSLSVHLYSQGSSRWQDMNFARQQQQQHQQLWDYGGSYNLMQERRTFSGLYPTQQHPMVHHEYLHPPHPAQFQLQSHPQQQGFSGDTPMYYDSAPAPSMMPTSMQSFQGSYGHPAGAGNYGYASPLSSTAASVSEYGQGSPLNTPTPSTGVSDVGQRMVASEMEVSDAGCSHLQQHLQKEQSTGSPLSTPSINSRGSSLSSSLTLSPVLRSQTQVSQGPGSTVGPESASQFNVGPQQPRENSKAVSIRQLPSDRRANLEQPETSTVKTIARRQAQQPFSVSFTHNARTSSSTYQASASTATPQSVATMAISATPDVATSMSVDATTQAPDTATPHDSTTGPAPSVSCDHMMDRTQGGDQEQDQAFRRPLRQPYVPLMTFSSGTILGTRAEYSPQGPSTPIRLAHEPLISDFSVHHSSEGDLFAEAVARTTTAGTETTETMTISPSQRRDADSADEGHTQKTETALSASHPSGATPSQSPYSLQPRRNFFSPSDFLFHDLGENDELDRLLGLQSQHHVMDILRGDHEREGEMSEGNEGEVSEDVCHVIQGTTPPHLGSRSEGPTKLLDGRPQMMSPGTLATLHHFSKSNEGTPPSKTYSQRGGGSSPGSYTPLTAARSLDLPTSSSSNGRGSLGENEYLLHHQSRPPISRVLVRRYDATMGSTPGSGLGLGGSPSEGYGYMTAVSDGLGSGGLSLETGTGTGLGREDRSLTVDLPWTMGRQDDKTSSEIACQLFSGLGASRGGTGGEGCVNASSMGVGIGTAIGSRNSPGAGGTMYGGRTRSVQTLQLSDQEQYPFSEEQIYSRSVSPTTEQQLHQQHVGGAHGDTANSGVESPEDGASVRKGEHNEQEEADELKELGLYSRRSSDRGSPVEEFDEDDQIDSLGSNDSIYGDKVKGDVEGVDFEGGYGYSHRVREKEAYQGQVYNDDWTSGQELTSNVSSSQASTVSEESGY